MREKEAARARTDAGSGLRVRIYARVSVSVFVVLTFSNSPVLCLLTKVVFPTPPSPTRMSLNRGALAAAFWRVPTGTGAAPDCTEEREEQCRAKE